jgi:ribonuclease VapC
LIVVDTSALVSIYVPEDDAPALRQVLAAAEPILIPASCLVEFSLLWRLARDRHRWLSELLDRLSIELVPIDRAVAEIAAEAAERYGRGSRHPARLNFGDCLSYAVAKHLDAPLLYKGDDFIHTDIKSALAS